MTPVWPMGFPAVVISRPLYVGIARTTLAVRGSEMHLKTTRMSTLRRSLVALLVDELKLRGQIVPGPGQKFGLTAEGGLAPQLLDGEQPARDVGRDTGARDERAADRARPDAAAERRVRARWSVLTGDEGATARC